MAFNPFRAFRKHQKAMFAGLAVLSMFIFVLTGSMSAGWDFFMEVLHFFGATTTSHPAVATLYGKEVDAQEIIRLRRQRQIANQFMETATAQARNKMIESVQNALSGSEQGPELASVNKMLMMRTIVQQHREYYRDYINDLPNDIQQLYMIEARLEQTKKMPQAEQIRNLAQVLEQERRQALRPPGELFFGGSIVPDKLLDFLIWRHQADRLGILFTDDDVENMVNNQTQKQLDRDDYKRIDEYLYHHYGRYTRTQFFQALRDEFRVRLAKEALGYPSEMHGSRQVVTPYALWQFYRENRSQASVEVLPIPVHDFIAGAVGKNAPSVQELKELYEKSKDQEYDPGAATPGFKQPPRIEVQWVKASADGPYYRQRGQAMVAMRAMLPAAFQVLLLRDYDLLKATDFKAVPWTTPLSLYLYPTLIQPKSIASLAGQVVGTATLQGPALLPAVLVEQSALAAQAKEVKPILESEVRARTQVYATFVLARFNPVPLAPVALWTEAGKDRSVPLELVRERLIEKQRNEVARKLAADALASLKHDLEAINKLHTSEEVRQFQKANRPENVASVLGLAGAALGAAAPTLLASSSAATMVPRGVDESALISLGLSPLQTAVAVARYQQMLPAALAQAAIERHVKEGGLVRGGSQKPRDAYTIADDPGLKALREAYRASINLKDVTGQMFAQLFFAEKSQPAHGLYTPGQEVTTGDESFLYWEDAEKPAYVPTFKEARERVVQRWQLEKARPLAEAAAHELEKKAQEGGQPLQNLADAATQFKQRIFYLENVAPLVPTAGGGLKRYEIPDTQREDIPYPSTATVAQLLTLKEKGQVTVFSDQPQTTYYVAVARWRYPPPLSSFYADYANPNLRSQLVYLREIEGHYEQNDRQALLESLRAEARLHINEENLKTLESRTRSEEED